MFELCFLTCHFLVRIPTFHVVSVSFVALINEAMPDHYMRCRRWNGVSYTVLFLWILLASLVMRAYK